MLRRLSVFTGGATLDSAEQVLRRGRHRRCSPAWSTSRWSWPPATPGPLPRCWRPSARTAPSGSPRPARTSGCGHAHARYFLDLAETAEPQLRRRDQLHLAGAARPPSTTTARRAAARDRHARRGDRAAPRRRRSAGTGSCATTRPRRAAGRSRSGRSPTAGPPPGTEDAYAICGFTAALVTEMSRDGGPKPETPAHGDPEHRPRIGPDTTHPALALCRSARRPASPADMEETERELDKIADHPDPWARAARHAFVGVPGVQPGGRSTGRRRPRTPRTPGSARSATAGGWAAAWSPAPRSRWRAAGTPRRSRRSRRPTGTPSKASAPTRPRYC